FWAFPLSSVVRNFRFRLLHFKLPCRLTLNHIVPVYFPSPLCLLCLAEPESASHFLYACPRKRPMWL
ncbi:uncharacterized protein BYT42DRAFT_477901, partial [Radiomyces spectabilis]|uniref:uncharacterized protein n=1 Tax=Radiomyces spectabilis TaxID=64574 RepID=UPI00222088CB